MIEINDTLVPFQGLSDIKLYQNLEEAYQLLGQAGLLFRTEVVDNAECTIPVPWTLIYVSDVLILSFANNKLFKIDAIGTYQGELPNGIRIGMSTKEAEQIDSELKYDDWNEDFESPSGYWLEDDPSTGLITTLTIFIKEIDNEDFEECKW